MTPDTPPPRSPPHHFAEHIRASALTLAIGGGLMLYFGLVWVPTPPANASPESIAAWSLWHAVLQWSIRGVAVFLLVAAVASLSGRPGAALLATIADTSLTIVTLTLAVSWTVQARLSGYQYDVTAILMLLLTLLGIHGAISSWRLYRAATGALSQQAAIASDDPPDESRHD